MRVVTPIETAVAMQLSENVLTAARQQERKHTQSKGEDDFKIVFDAEVKKLKEAGSAKEIGERIKALCEEKEITTHELSKVAAVTEVSLSRYMGGYRKPNAVALHNIAVALDTTMEYLITGEKG